ncbi:transglycosylase SLT domain-containing protein [Bartonella saheliensis]|uniref:transglycosylase SLT domain-containing protein n=1 Tax=Bartonella saheliensis TaxID=1457016 RepID=UPI00119DBDC2|nr:transglycosylase SLT domain-containing protein [Bartonella saheliensis]
MSHFSPHVKQAIAQAAQKYGLPESFLQRVAMIESNGNPYAKNSKSSAGGLYQFLDSTAKQYQLHDKFDPFQATDALARLTKDNTRYLTTALGREPSEAELYLAHQQGPAGAVKLIKNPTLPASQLLGRQAVTLNGGKREATAEDFMNHVYKLYNNTQDSSKETAQQSLGNGQSVENEGTPLRTAAWLQKTIEGSQAREPLMAYARPLSDSITTPESGDALTGGAMKNTPWQGQGIDASALKGGVMRLLDLIRRNADAQEKQIERIHQQMMQQPMMAGFLPSTARQADLTPLIDPSRRQFVDPLRQQKMQQR